MVKLMNYNEIDIKDIEAWITNPNWEMQQKVDGIRARLVVDPFDGEGKKVKVLNSHGSELVSTTAAPVVAKLVAFGETFLSRVPSDYTFAVEGEIVGEDFWAFDLIWEAEMYGPGHEPHIGPATGWRYRRQALDDFITAFTNHLRWFKQVPTYRTTDDKAKLWAAIKMFGVEGAVFKHVDGGVIDGARVDHVLKAKVRHTIDAFVIERGPGNGRNGSGNSLSFGLYKKDGSIYPAGRCSFIGKPYAAPGDVIEIKYLYAGSGGALVQPTHIRNRPDKNPEDCTTDQLHFVSKQVINIREGGGS